MSDDEAAGTAGSLVPGAHRLIRALGADEGPFAGTLVSCGDSVAVCVDVTTLEGWAGWEHSGAEHIAGAVDVVRHFGGHDVLLPWCIERVSVFLGRRRAAGAALMPGEITTLVISLLRGLTELGQASVAEGEWWMTHTARPIFVHQSGGATAREAAQSLLERVTEDISDRALRRLLEEIVAALVRPRLRETDEACWEEELLAIAAPRALRMDSFEPARARDLDPHGAGRIGGASEPGPVRRRVDARRQRTRHVSPALRVRLRDLLSRFVGERAVVPRLPSRRGARADVDRRVRGRATRRDEDTKVPTRRGRRTVVAGAAATVVLGVGLMWPAEAADESSDPSNAVTIPQAEEGSGRGGDEAIPPEGDDDQPTAETTEQLPEPPTVEMSADAAVPALLDELAVCIATDDTRCAKAMAEGAAPPDDGLATAGSASSAAILVDDYGDLAVVRLDAIEPGVAAQMLVLLRHNDLWLVRDVLDVAHQPER